MFAGQTWWVIGASAGLGRALALKLADAGAQVVASARDAQALEHLCKDLRLTALPMDVTDPGSVQAACAQLPQIDAVVYCAGAYDPMRAQDWDQAQIEQMLDVNFTGATRVVGQILPGLLAQNRGRIALIGSLAGYRGLPGAIGYGASKAALMHLAENLMVDLRGTGVKVQQINPGFIETRLTQKNDFAMPQIMTPDRAADHVMGALHAGRFETAFPRPFAWLFILARFIPRGLYYRLFAKGA